MDPKTTTPPRKSITQRAVEMTKGIDATSDPSKINIPPAKEQAPAPDPNAVPPEKDGTRLSTVREENARQEAEEQQKAAEEKAKAEKAKEEKKQEPPADPKKEEPKADDQIKDEDDTDAAIEKAAEGVSNDATVRHAFKKVRFENRDFRRKIRDMETKLAQFESGEGAPLNSEQLKELETLRRESEQAKKRLEEVEPLAYATKIEAAPEFKSQVSVPRENAARNIQKIADAYPDLTPDAVVAAIRSGDPAQMTRVTEAMSELHKYEFYAQVMELRRIDSVETDLRTNAKDRLETLETDRRAQLETNSKKEKEVWTGAENDAWKDLVENFPSLEVIEGDTEWNEQVEKIRSFASMDRFNKLTPREKAEVLHRSGAFTVALAEIETMRQELEAKEAEIAKLTRASAGLGGRGGGGAGPAATTTPKVREAGGFVKNVVAGLAKATAQ